jgi:hypothetical protein
MRSIIDHRYNTTIKRRECSFLTEIIFIKPTRDPCIGIQKLGRSWAPEVQAYNPSYLGNQAHEDLGLRPAWRGKS